MRVIDTDRLKTRLARRGISQAELARRVGLQQSTINLLFNGRSQSTTKLRDIARELNTTPEYLEGLTDDPTESFAGSIFSDEEIEWIGLLRATSAKEREAMLILARSIANLASKTMHDRQLQYRPG